MRTVTFQVEDEIIGMLDKVRQNGQIKTRFVSEAIREKFEKEAMKC